MTIDELDRKIDIALGLGKVPVTILKGNEVHNWKNSRGRVRVDYQKRDKLDGITRPFHFIGNYTLGEPLINED